MPLTPVVSLRAEGFGKIRQILSNLLDVFMTFFYNIVQSKRIFRRDGIFMSYDQDKRSTVTPASSHTAQPDKKPWHLLHVGKYVITPRFILLVTLIVLLIVLAIWLIVRA